MVETIELEPDEGVPVSHSFVSDVLLRFSVVEDKPRYRSKGRSHLGSQLKMKKGLIGTDLEYPVLQGTPHFLALYRFFDYPDTTPSTFPFVRGSFLSVPSTVVHPTFQGLSGPWGLREFTGALVSTGLNPNGGLCPTESTSTSECVSGNKRQRVHCLGVFLRMVPSTPLFSAPQVLR